MTDEQETNHAFARSRSNAGLDGKWCYYCKKDTHNDAECWCTRPAGWTPSHVQTVPEIWLPPNVKVRGCAPGEQEKSI